MSNSLSPHDHQLLLILDFGGQTQQLIARRVRELGVYSQVLPGTTSLERITALAPRGLIFTGGPSFVDDPAAPRPDPRLYELGVPILGICYGCQLLAAQLGGQVARLPHREYGRADLQLTPAGQGSGLLAGLPTQSISWMSHTSSVARLPVGFETLASTPDCPVAIMGDAPRHFYGVQFHPEVTQTQIGRDLLRNFLLGICGFTGDWQMNRVAEEMVAALRAKIGDQSVLCALSGGVDSAVCATLLHQAVGERLTAVFIDHGLLRQDEAAQVAATFGPRLGRSFIAVDESQTFLTALAGVTDPEAKRQIIGREFIRAFERQAKKIGHVRYFAQGTIYPDVIESGTATAAKIKSHHNVGGLPAVIDFDELLEPLRQLFKDEVRQLGLTLGLPAEIVDRQPFPGPGLAIRIIGEVTPDKLAILRPADAIFRQEIAAAGLDRRLSQYFAVLTNLRTVGVMGDERTYDYLLGLRAVETTDFMTAQWAALPADLLDRVARRIVNEVPHINRVVYEITSKPPSTIEWE